jgi:cytochrome oxidase Cu insertion factor (SCO1/SenC/PrrC family)
MAGGKGAASDVYVERPLRGRHHGSEQRCPKESKRLRRAFQQIADRLEGKPVQVVDATVDDNRTVQQFSDAELTAILRRRVGVVPAESDEQRPEAEPLN